MRTRRRLMEVRTGLPPIHGVGTVGPVLIVQRQILTYPFFVIEFNFVKVLFWVRQRHYCFPLSICVTGAFLYLSSSGQLASLHMLLLPTRCVHVFFFCLLTSSTDNLSYHAFHIERHHDRQPWLLFPQLATPISSRLSLILPNKGQLEM